MTSLWNQCTIAYHTLYANGNKEIALLLQFARCYRLKKHGSLTFAIAPMRRRLYRREIFVQS